MARIDYYDDPEAPAANSVVPSANVVVVNDDGALLLIHRTDNDNWALPGGAMDLGESLVDTAVREPRRRPGSTARSRVLSASTPTRSTSSSTPVTAKPGRNSPSCSPPARPAAPRPRAASPARSCGCPGSDPRADHGPLDADAGPALPRARPEPYLG